MFMGCCFSTSVKAESHSHNDIRSKTNMASSSSVLLTSRTGGEILQSNNLNLQCFTFNEVRTATRNFRPDNLVGEGDFGSVFKGWIDGNTLAPTKQGTGFVIAVKRLHQKGYDDHSEWLTKINYLGQLQHPNLVRLIGYYLEDHHRILVYEFVAKGSLDNHLFRRSSYSEPLSWKIRMKIALGAAKGLAFLHSDEVEVMHGDLKTSNILIDSNYNAKLSDFGLAKDGPEGDKSHVSTRVMGTLGYGAPEYIATGCLTKKNDVYNFGVVLLEIMSGKHAVDINKRPPESRLVDWAKPFLISKRKISQVMDARIKGQYSLREAIKVAGIAIQCLSAEPEFRPNIDEVVRSLEQLQDSKDTVGGVGSSQSQHQTIKTNGNNSSNKSGNSKQHGKSVDESLNGEDTSNPSSSASPLRT